MCESITNIIRGHSRALIAIGAQNLPEYHISDETKCLNSAVSLLFLLMGRESVKHTRYCDVVSVRERYDKHNPSEAMARALAYDLTNSPNGEKEVFYCMLTDGWMHPPSNPAVKVYFPGHVFIIERVGDKGFSMYQSYIQEYDLDAFLSHAAGPVTHTAAQLKAVSKGLVHMFSVPVWDRQCSDFWRSFTLSSGEAYEGYSMSSILLCYQRILLSTCTGSLRSVLEATHRNLAGKPASALFVKDSTITNSEMYRHVLDMQAKLPKINPLPPKKNRANVEVSSALDEEVSNGGHKAPKHRKSSSKSLPEKPATPQQPPQIPGATAARRAAPRPGRHDHRGHRVGGV